MSNQTDGNNKNGNKDPCVELSHKQCIVNVVCEGSSVRTTQIRNFFLTSLKNVISENYISDKSSSMPGSILYKGDV